MSKSLRNYAISMMFLRGVTRQWKVAKADRTISWHNRCQACEAPLLSPYQKHIYCVPCWDGIQQDIREQLKAEAEEYDVKEEEVTHYHPCYRSCKKNHNHSYGVPCDDSDCRRCPSCGGRYDGLDYGGLGCSRRCAYGDYRDRW